MTSGEMVTHKPKPPVDPRVPRSVAPPEYRSEDLLKSTREATILHRGQRYILRETRTGKLILYK